MSLAPKPRKLKQLRDRWNTFLAPTAAAEPSASTLSPSPTHNNQDTDTPKNTSLLHNPSLRLSSHTSSPRPERRQHRSSSPACVVSSSLLADSSAVCVGIQSHVYTGHASSMLADVPEALDDHERETIRALLSPNTIKVDAALGEARSRAEELQARSAMKRWCWVYQGRNVYVQDQTDKLVRFIDKFKFVGDTVANIDPVHIRLPWAGVRSILEVYSPDASAP
jgi:hypothetical protein